MLLDKQFTVDVTGTEVVCHALFWEETAVLTNVILDIKKGTSDEETEFNLLETLIDAKPACDKALLRCIVSIGGEKESVEDILQRLQPIDYMAMIGTILNVVKLKDEDARN